jgi:dimethylargininase
LGVPIFDKVLTQHARYCEALRECGLAITALEADLHYSDSTFVEDTAIVTGRGAILTRPGAESRAGETIAIRATLAQFFPQMFEIVAPGTLDGGDICEAENHFFLGLSRRTNEEGCRQLAAYLQSLGYTSSIIDIRKMTSILHLKSGVSYIGDNTMLVIDELRALLPIYQRISVAPAENYAANCVRVNDRVFVASGYPHITAELENHGFHPLVLDMSEFQKMDGGLSCLSLRF